MKDNLFHLPEPAQSQINAVAHSILEAFHPEKIILFGSYAKGTQVQDKYIENGILFEYTSDYDFLVVMKDGSIKSHLIEDKITNKFHFHTPINIISHDIDYVNHGLSFGQYFFTDIVDEGVLLYDSGNYTFEKARVLSPSEEKQKAQDYYDIWFDQGSEFLDGATFYGDRKSYRPCAFILHQATECFFNTVLLVFTGYKPKTHNLAKLRNYTKNLSKELHLVFLQPPDDQNEEKLFDLLKRGYIDARYSLDYRISKDETQALILKIKKMKVVVDEICQQKINSYD